MITPITYNNINNHNKINTNLTDKNGNNTN